MLSIRRARNDQQVEFCERCGSVCDSARRIEALRSEVLTRTPLNGWRIA